MPSTSSAAEVLRAGTAAGAWTLDASRSQIQLKSKSVWGLVPVKGVFNQVTGSGTVSPSGDVTGTIEVGAESIDTKNSKRDQHLKSADFFDAANHPAITFTVQRVTPSGDGVTVAGQLSVRGRERPVSFEAQVAGFDGDEVSLDGELQVNRSDFGLNWNQLGMSSMVSTITVHAVFARQ
jgi:polyisoprenoid-binding protein YceI